MAKQVVRSCLDFHTLLPDRTAVEVNITRKDITLLMLESHKKAENATEEIAALREIAKLNDLYPSSSSRVEVEITHVEQSLRDLERLPTAQLLRMAGEADDLLSLPEPIDAEYVEIKEERRDTEAETVGITSVMPLEDV